MIELDEIDFRMIEILQPDGRTPILELADRVGLSPTPCSQRRLRLERKGFIAKYCAAVNVKAIGKPSRVWSKKRESAHDTNRVLQTARVPQILSLPAVTTKCYWLQPPKR
jgi:DNA-binding Lrp family transcriptional regulator